MPNPLHKQPVIGVGASGTEVRTSQFAGPALTEGETMMRMVLLVPVLALVVAALPLAPARGQMIGNAPWCAVVETGAGRVESDCEFYSVEQCRPNVLGGNRGFCQLNPYYRGRLAPGHSPRHHRRYAPDR